MNSKFVYFSTKELAFLAEGHQLVLNVHEHIMTLMIEGRIHAQGQFPRNAFRLLVLLLKLPGGADYAELLACLHCSEPVFKNLLTVSSHEQIIDIFGNAIERWTKHLELVAAQGQAELEKELKTVRRAVKERHGANTLLKANGFSLRIKANYRKGYFLDSAPTSVSPTSSLQKTGVS